MDAETQSAQCTTKNFGIFLPSSNGHSVLSGTPNVVEELDPVLAHDPLYSPFGPTPA